MQPNSLLSPGAQLQQPTPVAPPPQIAPPPVQPTSTQPSNQVPAGLDPTAFILTKAIKQAESGGSTDAYNVKGDNGTSTGAYQIQQKNWGPWAQQYLGDANAPTTPENQNQLAHMRVKDLLSKGYTQSQVASIWNSGSPDPTAVGSGTNTKLGVNYDVPGYVSKVQQAYQQIQQQFQPPPIGQAGGLIPTANAQTPGQPSVSSQGPSVSGFIGNAASSAGNLLGGLGNAVMHPIQTAENVGGMAAGGVEKLFGANNADTQKFDNLISYFKNRYGGDSLSQIVGNIGNTLYKDPVGAALDVSTLVDGLGGTLGAVAKVGKFSELGDAANTLHTAAEAVNPIGQGAKVAGAVAQPIASGIGALAKTAVSHSTGLEPATMETILNNPSLFSKTAMENTSRGGILDDVTSGLQNLENQYSETGKMYNGIRNGEGTVNLPENFLSDILQKGTLDESGNAIKYGLDMTPKAEGAGFDVTANTSSFTRNPGDIAAIQKFVDNWGNKQELTPQEFLNMRSDAKDMAKYGKDLGTNKGAQLLGRSIRAELNKAGRPQVPGLATADSMTGEQLPLIQKVTKDLYNPDGTLKDNAAGKVSNALNKAGLMDRLEKVTPGITQKLNVLKAVEDIEKASGIKVGSYARNVLEVGAGLTGNIPAMIGAIITHPKIATQILRGAGYTSKATIMPILAKVRGMIGALPKTTFSTAAKIGVEANRAGTPGQASAK